MERFPSIFIDRDGTVNVDGGYINHPDNFIIYPFAAQAIRMLNKAGYLVIIVTNQSGIGRGFYTEEMMSKLHEKMVNHLRDEGAEVDGIYYCPHDISSTEERYRVKCDCRKPNPGMLLQAMRELPVDPERTFIIGDKYSDLKAGWAVGSKGILVKTGYGKGDLESKSVNWGRMPDYCAENLLEAAFAIVNNKLS